MKIEDIEEILRNAPEGSWAFLNDPIKPRLAELLFTGMSPEQAMDIIEQEFPKQ